MGLIIMALGAAHDVKRFDCGTDALNTWLREIASQHMRKGISKTYVLVEEEKPQTILGFYTVAIHPLTPVGELPFAMQRRLPAEVPGYTIARLAVTGAEQGYGRGEYLLAHAMRRIKATANAVGGTFLFVDAKDAKTAAFYAKYGCSAMPSNPLRLVMPINQIPG
ncbi:N-acetyltransferase [Janthinobacterium lividum]|uniref:N-acetyltransferase n=1 Tax=Janthinobacterium lividum TaxID=29581 RepID=A0ABU0XLG4_9BURK|nr:N-acetyltransferase [Janthinobacterium lividum]MDQ4624348.1 N-acetyltransferase [Janthinobacterium lividum]MDQ4674048.1 N-acetyltransferase [Janthinobacterium lividum]MDQ4684778.1 N-acetyltransferase [Janthinobacterium lividum]